MPKVNCLLFADDLTKVIRWPSGSFAQLLPVAWTSQLLPGQSVIDRGPLVAARGIPVTGMASQLLPLGKMVSRVFFRLADPAGAVHSARRNRATHT